MWSASLWLALTRNGFASSFGSQAGEKQSERHLLAIRSLTLAAVMTDVTLNHVTFFSGFLSQLCSLIWIWRLGFGCDAVVCVWSHAERPKCVFSTYYLFTALSLRSLIGSSAVWRHSVNKVILQHANPPLHHSLSLSLERARGCCVIKQPDLTAGSSAVQLKHVVCWRGAEPRWERMSRTLLRIWTISRRSRRARVCFSWVMRLRFNMETESTCYWEVRACRSLHVCLLPWRRAAAQVEDGGRFVLTRPLLRRVCSGGYQGSWRGRRNTTGHGPAQTPTVCLSQQQQRVWTRSGPVNYQFIETETGSSASETLRLMLVCPFSELVCSLVHVDYSAALF